MKSLGERTAELESLDKTELMKRVIFAEDDAMFCREKAVERGMMIASITKAIEDKTAWGHISVSISREILWHLKN